MCIVFNKNKFAHARKFFKEQKTLNIYQLNILSNIIFMHRLENKTAPSIFLAKFCKLSHAYPTHFSAHNFLVLALKLKYSTCDGKCNHTGKKQINKWIKSKALAVIPFSGLSYNSCTVSQYLSKRSCFFGVFCLTTLSLRGISNLL